MKQKIKFTKLQVALLALIGILLFAYWVSTPCNVIRYIYVSMFRHTPYAISDWNLQVPLGEVWPYKKTSLMCYYLSNKISGVMSRGVGIGVDGFSKIDADVDPSLYFQNKKYYDDKAIAHPFEERTSLYIDGNLTSNSSKQIIEFGDVGKYFGPAGVGSGYYDISWYPNLSLGKHTAKIVIETLSRKTIEYEWEFTLTIW